MEKICHRFSCEIAFSDTDASGWAHFSKILTYPERAEHDFLEKSGILVFDQDRGGWPRVRVECDYRSPLRFQDKIEVRLSLSKIGTGSLVWKFEIFKQGDILAAEGGMVSVKVNEKGIPTALTPGERKKLEVYL